jgi:glycerol-3-phosphate dehydrogenase subunit B
LEGNAQTIDDIRRDIRLGMGPCQAGFCSVRATGMLHQMAYERQKQSEESRPSFSMSNTNAALHDFLQERWKGAQPILWGQQLRQERLNEFIYLDVLNANHLPGSEASRLGPGKYELEAEDREPQNTIQVIHSTQRISPLTSVERSPRQPEMLVIGAGLAGLTAAWRASAAGIKVKVIAKGWGANHWGSGCVDMLGYYPHSQEEPVVSPQEALNQLVQNEPRHPYALAGLDSITMAMRNLQDLFAQAGYPLHGSLDENWLLPTALGTMRSTCLAPESMIAGDLRKRTPMLIVGFEQYLDFYPALVADNLNAQNFSTRAMLLDIPSLKKRRLVNGMILARLFDKPEFRAEVAKALKSRLEDTARIGFPAVLGMNRSWEVIHDLETQLGCPVFEIPGLPPSVPGIRIHNLLVHAIQLGGGQIFDGMLVSGAHGKDHHLQAILTEASTHPAIHPADTFVIATGGILGGGITTHYPGYAQNKISETALGLPIQTQIDRKNWLQQKFLDARGHPIFSVGLAVNGQFQPVDENANPWFDNLHVIGGALGNCDPIRERSLEGVAIATAWTVVEHHLAKARSRSKGNPQ